MTSDKTAKIILGRDGMGTEASEADFDAWVAYVNQRIDKMCGFMVYVEERRPRDVQTDQVRAASDDDERTVQDALTFLWESFCADDAAWPRRKPA